MIRQHLKKNSFTLVELLTVMVLMGLLFAIAIPSMNSAQSNATTSAASDVEGQLAIARAYSMTNHCYTAVIFPQEDELKKAVVKEADILTDYYNASMRICVVTPSANANEYDFIMWLPASGWVKFPHGAVMEDGTSGNISFSGGGTPPKIKDVYIGHMERLTGNKNASVDDSSVKTDIARAIVFDKTGEIAGRSTSSTTNTVKMNIAEGFYNTKSKKVVLMKRSGSNFYTELRINPITARVFQETKD